MRIFISGGSNIEPEKNVKICIQKLYNQFDVLDISDFYRSIALDENGKRVNNNYYINFGILISSDLDYDLIVDKLKEIELSMGRIKNDNKFKDRIIDLDVVYYDNEIKEDNSGELQYAFIAFPMRDLAPNYIHPKTFQKLSDIADKVNSKFIEKIRLE